jgi:uncharacterized delta-60 repeat protein
MSLVKKVNNTIYKQQGRPGTYTDFVFSKRLDRGPTFISDRSMGLLQSLPEPNISFVLFNTGEGTNAQVTSTAIDSNGKIYLGGIFTNYSGSTFNRIVKVNTDGTIDSTFSIGTGFGSNNNVRVIKPLLDGKVLVGGSLTSYNGTGITHLIRVNSDGTRDTSFSPGTVSSAVNDLAIQPDGKIIVAGQFTTFSGSSTRGLVRINSNGSVDSSFNTGGGLASSEVNSITIQSDGKIIVAAGNATYSGSTTQKIIRVNNDGTIDTSFTAPALGAGNPDFVTLDLSERILVGGAFSSPTNDIMRLSTDGSRDTSFNVGVGSNNAVEHIAFQSDGRIIIGGTFTSYSGSNINRLARLNTDGTLDTEFSSSMGTGFTNNAIETITVQTDDYVLVGGSFTAFSGSTVNRIIRLGPNGQSQG